MNQFLKIGLIAGAGYFLFHQQLAAAFPNLFGGHAGSSGSSGNPAPAPADATPPVPQPVTGETASSAQTTKALLLKWAQGNDFYRAQNGLMNAWQWGFGYHQIRGGEFDFASQFTDPSRLMTLDEFWQGVTNAGLSGVAVTPRSRTARAWSY